VKGKGGADQRLDQPQLFGERDFEILKFLTIHPTSSYSDAARSLHYRPETVARHIQSLKERNLYAGTMGLLCYQTLGLAYVPVLVRAPLGNLDAVFNACRAHPYIHYSSRTLGSTDGAFLTFTPPIESTGLLVEFFDELAARGLVTDHRVYVCNDVKRYFVNADLQIYKRTAGVWDFNWKRWLEEDVGPASKESQLLRVQIEPNLDRLDGGDIRLLSTITNDASIPTEEMSKATGLLPHQVRRRRRFL
jgi:DNA-binding Lrp family transcriptional regulator